MQSERAPQCLNKSLNIRTGISLNALNGFSDSNGPRRACVTGKRICGRGQKMYPPPPRKEKRARGGNVRVRDGLQRGGPHVFIVD